MAEAFFEIEGGEERAEDAVYMALPHIGMVKVTIPDDTGGDGDADDDAQGRQ